MNNKIFVNMMRIQIKMNIKLILNKLTHKMGKLNTEIKFNLINKIIIKSDPHNSLKIVLLL